MQEGSLVVMVTSLNDASKFFLVKNGIRKWPEPNEDIIYTVTGTEVGQGKLFIDLDLYPELAEFTAINACLFRELEPPSVNMDEIIEMSKIPVKDKPKVRELEPA